MELSLNQVLVGVFSLVLIYTTTQLGKLLTTKAKEVLSNAKDEKVGATIIRIIDLIQDVVDYINITVVNDLKEASKDGKLTTAEKSEIFNLAMERIKDMLTLEMCTVLSSLVGNVDLWLETKIEQSVNKAKKK